MAIQISFFKPSNHCYESQKCLENDGKFDDDTKC